MGCMNKSNMYPDMLPWNVFVGCRRFNCSYCDKSFKAQMKRQMPKFDKDGIQYRGCQQCYDYEPHFHEDRITKEYCKKHFAKAKEDQFIWVGSSGDISFIKDENMILILEKIKSNPDRMFFFQTKNPEWFQRWIFPENVILGITLESNIHYPEISKAPKPWKRATDFYFVQHPRKIITIEPVLEFDHDKFLPWIRDISPERVYIGFDTRKNNLPEPSLDKVRKFVIELEKWTKVKEKYMKA